jgi:hypothetical protein
MEQFWSEFLYFQNMIYIKDMFIETIFIFLFPKYHCKKPLILKLSN